MIVDNVWIVLRPPRLPLYKNKYKQKYKYKYPIVGKDYLYGSHAGKKPI